MLPAPRPGCSCKSLTNSWAVHTRRNLHDLLGLRALTGDKSWGSEVARESSKAVDETPIPEFIAGSIGAMRFAYCTLRSSAHCDTRRMKGVVIDRIRHGACGSELARESSTVNRCNALRLLHPTWLDDGPRVGASLLANSLFRCNALRLLHPTAWSLPVQCAALIAPYD